VKLNVKDDYDDLLISPADRQILFWSVIINFLFYECFH